MTPETQRTETNQFMCRRCNVAGFADEQYRDAHEATCETGRTSYRGLEDRGRGKFPIIVWRRQRDPARCKHWHLEVWQDPETVEAYGGRATRCFDCGEETP